MGLADLSCFLPTTAWSQFGPNVRYKDFGQKQSSALPSKSKGCVCGGGGVVLQNRGGKGKGNIKISLKCIKTNKSEIVTPKTLFPKTHTFLTTTRISLQDSGYLRGPALRVLKIVN